MELLASEHAKPITHGVQTTLGFAFRKRRLFVFLLAFTALLAYLQVTIHITVNTDDIIRSHIEEFALHNPVDDDGLHFLQGEKFLTYTPHSGLSNQRIELENALLLAIYLNRTLLIPPAFLGKMPSWQPRGNLRSILDITTAEREWALTCDQGDGQPTVVNNVRTIKNCRWHYLFAKNSLVVPWTVLHNFTNLTPYVRMRQRPDMSVAGMKRALNLSDEDIFFPRDRHMYDWVLYDDEHRPKKQRQYQNHINLHHFQSVPHKLLHLGGIFGTNRVHHDLPKHKYMHKLIERTMMYSNPILDETVREIVKFLGGQASYYAIHVRTEDAQFATLRERNLRSIITDLQQAFPRYSHRKHSQKTLDECLKDDDSIIYIATDNPRPRSDPNLRELFASFPCIITFADIPSHLLSSLHSVPKDNHIPQASEDQYRFWIPIIDAMIAGNGNGFSGSQGSTFSKYINRMQSVWKDVGHSHHGLESLYHLTE
ncbi:hypothetical protein BZG36_00237 [Bifiguratus adelaidae]|uniref:O-fucosyltransferase family protein n=1 Tax=Bifiguratus adelaidae TaxID=1938954 RepID=A0A261Y8S6_9FUNG|nr:hypothetical protein BZG36_00237 [Bifiguratus adelaidae]